MRVASNPFAAPTASAWLASLRRLYPATTYALAVSGGPDSTALLALASKAMRLKNAPHFIVLTVDHNLRAGSAAEAKSVAKLCKRLGLRQQTLTWSGAKPTTAIQNAARDIRYGLMEAYCSQHGVEALVLAHHREDQAETLLMRMARGSGLTGLSAMSPVQKHRSINLLRPLLHVSKENLQALCHKAGLEFVLDPSNSDDRHERVRLRAAQNGLDRIGLTSEKLSLTIDKLAQVDDDLELLASRFLSEHSVFDTFGVFRVDREAFCYLPITLQERVVLRAIKKISRPDFPPRRDSMAGVLKVLNSRETTARTLMGVLFHFRKSEVLIGREYSACPVADKITFKNNAVISTIWDRRFEVSYRRSSAKAFSHIGPLGSNGLAQFRADHKSAGLLTDNSVPARFIYTVPAFWQKDRLVFCPTLRPEEAAEREVSAVLLD